MKFKSSRSLKIAVLWSGTQVQRETRPSPLLFTPWHHVVPVYGAPTVLGPGGDHGRPFCTLTVLTIC